jgi:hypothetical protein
MTGSFALIVFCLNMEPSLLNGKVVEFARANLCHRVGSGDCRSLAVEALRHAGSRVPGRGETSWGDEVKSLKDARPGDILQFQDAVCLRKRGPKPVLVILKEWTIDMAELKRGSVKVYRPVVE